MDTQFNVFEVLQIAEEIERRAARFYRKAAEQFTDSARRGICYDLASWRIRHERGWIRLRREYSERTGEFGTFDPDNYVRSNPQVMAGLPWFGIGCSLRDRPTGRENGAQIIQDAIRRAEGVRTFYHGLKEFARDPGGRDMIEAMIDEEGRHIRQLNHTLEQTLRSAGDSIRPVCHDSICVGSDH